MTEVYQPLIIRTLIENGGFASTRQLALAVLPYDTSQVEYYEVIMKRWPKKTLKRHEVITYRRGEFALNTDISLLSENQKKEITSLCTKKIQGFLNARLARQHKVKIPTHITGLMRYEVLKLAKGRCSLCGVTKEERALDVDHIIPRSLGGKTEFANLQALCYVCNRSKGNQDKTDFRNSINPVKNPNCRLCCSGQSVTDQNYRAFALSEKENSPLENIIVVPKRHVSSFFDLDQKEVNDCYALLRKGRKSFHNQHTNLKFEISISEIHQYGNENDHTYIRLIPHWGSVSSLVPKRGL